MNENMIGHLRQWQSQGVGLTFEELCEAVRLYVEEISTEGGRGNRDNWRDRLDDTLANIRAELSSCFDEEPSA